MTTLEFLKLLFGTLGASLWLVLWGRSGTRSFPISDLSSAAGYAIEQGQSQDIYFAPGLQAVEPLGRARGEARTVGVIPGLWLDLDVAGGAHAKEAAQLPTMEQAKLLLENAPWQPTITIHTGGGLHAYWLFQEPWVLDTSELNQAAQHLSRSFQYYFIDAGHAMGFHVDCTAPINQVLRLPGTRNHKYNPAFQVTIQQADETRRYTVDEIKAGLPAQAVSTELSAKVIYLPGTLPIEEDYPPASQDLIEQHCPFMAHCQADAATLSEPEWFAQATILTRCQDGEKLFHERSAPHPGYNPKEAQAKLDQARKYGPRTCVSIRRDLGFTGCDSCPYRAHVKSPIRLGDESPLAQARIVIAKALVEATNDPGAMFTEPALAALTVVASKDMALMMRVRDTLKKLGIPLKKLEEAMKNKLREAKASGQVYRVEDNRFVMEKVTLAGPVDVNLGNFHCVITEEVTRDDGAEKAKRFMLEGFHESGQPLPTTEVSVHQFACLNWVLEQYGSRAVIYAGCKDHFRVAIQTCSEDVIQRTLYTHTGWREIGDEYAYLSGGGALGHKGLIENIEVDLGEAGLKDYLLEIPSSPNQAKTAIAVSLKMLELAPKEIAAPLLAGTYLAPLGQALKIDFSLFLSGLTGTRKSEIAAIAQGHYGPEFRGKNLPANWSSTPNSLEKICFLAKDALTVVDDFNPVGSQYDINAYHKKADQLMRGQGNQAGRQRMRADGTLRPTYFPRGLILGTGEDIPRGQSLRARTLVLEVVPTDVNLDVLSELQVARGDGVLAQAMAAFVQWLAPQMDTLADTLPDRKQVLRQEALEAGKAHSRTPDIIASLMVGVEMFLRFATDHGAITKNQAGTLWGECQDAIREAAIRQANIQEEECPVQRFMELLASAMSGGSAHLEGSKGGLPQVNPEVYGWRETTAIVNNNQIKDHRPFGKRVGWVDDSGVYLDMEVAFGVAQSLASSQGNTIAIGPKTLQKRMANKGVIVSSESGVNTKRITLAGTRVRVLHISREALHPDITKPEELPAHFGKPNPGGNCLV